MCKEFILKEKFDLGQTAATPRCLEVIEDAGQTPDFFFDMHALGNWGMGCDEINDMALVSGAPLFSAYKTLKGVTVWVVSDPVIDGHRKMTVCILPEEYGETEQ
jgi:hypothetical protein